MKEQGAMTETTKPSQEELIDAIVWECDMFDFSSTPGGRRDHGVLCHFTWDEIEQAAIEASKRYIFAGDEENHSLYLTRLARVDFKEYQARRDEIAQFWEDQRKDDGDK